MITLTSKQEQGIRIAKERYRAGEKFTCIAGYETLDKFLIYRWIKVIILRNDKVRRNIK